ncbi:MAG TPA: type II CAAX endopeptidase family protein [Chloroflexia bacterium]|nr:type II CAAX endopeptidase family protein [Chloroflexia bacterium]
MNPLFLIGTLGLVTFLYWAAYQSARALRSKTIEISGNLLLSIPEFIFKLLLLGICFGLANTLDVPRLDKIIGWPSRQPVVDIVIGTAIGLVTAFVVNLLSIGAIRIWGKKIYSPELMKNLIPRNQLEWVLIIIPLFLAVALEEMLFRALLIGGYSVVVNPWAMALASSVVFGMMHSPQGILGIVLTGLVGLLFGAVFIITGSLLVVIIAHFAVNFLQIVRAKDDIAWYERFEDRIQSEEAELEPEGIPETSEPLT